MFFLLGGIALFFEPKDLATSRVILSVLFHLDKADGLTLKLRKKEITEHWVTSKSSKVAIVRAAGGLADCACFDVIGGMKVGGEEVNRMPFVESVEMTAYDVTFQFSPSAFGRIQVLRQLIFEKHSLYDFHGMGSRFTLNMLICCLRELGGMNRYISYAHIRKIMCTGAAYEETRAFCLNVVDMALFDLGSLKNLPIGYEIHREHNVQTKREKAVGVNIEWAARNGY